MTDQNEMQAALEAILFVATEPVPRRRLLEIFQEKEREAAGKALDTVLERHRSGDDRGFIVDEAAGGVRLVTRPELNGWLRKFFDVSGARKLSMGALETLAIIAYRQPITGPEIQELRSVSPVGVLKTLLERRLIRIQGRKQVVGKPFLYGTTREFLVHFGLDTLKDLPPLEELEEALADGELLETLVGPDREEEILRAEAKIDEAEAEAAERKAREAVEEERETAEQRQLAQQVADDGVEEPAKTGENEAMPGPETSAEGDGDEGEHSQGDEG